MKNVLITLLCALCACMYSCSDDETPAEPAGEPTPVFTIDLTELTTTSVKMTVTPCSDDTVYYFDIIEKHKFEEYHDSDWHTYISGFIEYEMGDEKTLEQVLSEITVKGKGEHTFENFIPKTDFIAVVMGLDKKGKINTEIITKEFSTEAIVSQNTFSINVTKTEYDNVEFEIIPTNDDDFFCTVYTKATCDKLSDDELMARTFNDFDGMMDFFKVNGKYTITREDNFTVWNTDTGYYIVVFGYENSSSTTKLYKFPVRTAKPAGEPANCKFKIEATDITSSGFSIAIEPSDKTVEYLWDIIPASEYAGHKDAMKKYAEDYAALDIDRIDANLTRGDEGNMYSYLEQDTEYYVWAVCMDEYGKTQAEVYISEPVRTSKTIIGTATVNVTMNNYFNGDEVYSLNPEKYKDCKGKAYVSIDFKASDDANIWYGTLSEEDLSSTDVLSDEVIILTFESNQSYLFPTGKLYICNWDEPYTVLAVAKDKSNNYGKVVRQVYTFTKAGASPISGFTEPEEPAAKQISLMRSIPNHYSWPAEAKVRKYKQTTATSHTIKRF